MLKPQEEGDKAREVERGSLGYLVTSKDLTRRVVGPPCALTIPCALTVPCALLTGKEAAGWMAEMAIRQEDSDRVWVRGISAASRDCAGVRLLAVFRNGWRAC